MQALVELPLWQWLTGIFHMPCVFHLVTGMYCPGCGGTRAIKYLLTGHPILSWCYHPLVLYAVVAVSLEVISAAIAKRIGQLKWYLGHEAAFLYGGLAIVIVNWVYKNYMLMVKGVDLLSAAL